MKVRWLIEEHRDGFYLSLVDDDGDEIGSFGSQYATLDEAKAAAEQARTWRKAPERWITTAELRPGDGRDIRERGEVSSPSRPAREPLTPAEFTRDDDPAVPGECIDPVRGFVYLGNLVVFVPGDPEIAEEERMVNINV